MVEDKLKGTGKIFVLMFLIPTAEHKHSLHHAMMVGLTKCKIRNCIWIGSCISIQEKLTRKACELRLQNFCRKHKFRSFTNYKYFVQVQLLETNNECIFVGARFPSEDRFLNFLTLKQMHQTLNNGVCLYYCNTISDFEMLW
jgi:hypothetical protein